MKFWMIAVFIVLLALPVQAQQAGWLGISIEDGQTQGASIRSVETDSPAAKVGLKAGDVVVEYNKTPVLGAMQLTRLIRETPSGRTVDVKVRRDNGEQVFQVTLARNPDRTTQLLSNFPMLDIRDRLDDMRLNAPHIQMSMSSVLSGIRVDSMTSQLRQFFGVNGDYGVLVASVDAASTAERAGLRAGDVITGVDNRDVRTPAEFDREMRSAGRKLSLHVVRDKKEIDITVDRTPEAH
jgi:serine protease Do